MSTRPSDLDLNLDAAVHTWDVLARHLDAFIDAWEQGDPPSLAEHLPEAGGALRRMALVEMIKVDLEYRAKAADLFKPLEQYAAQHPELAEAGGVPCDLIYEEYHVRKGMGEDVDAKEFFRRFPDKAEELRRLLGITTPVSSTALYGKKARTVELEPGDRVDDFSLLLRLGKGAFASVFLARQESMQRMVALKVSADRGQEPQTLAQLDHPNIVRVYDQRTVAEQRMRLLYMQYVAGGTLQGVIERVRRMPPSERTGEILLKVIDDELERNGQPPLGDSPARRALAATSWPKVVCRLGFQLAKALDHAHRKGVLHRDIKPANVLLGADGSPKLADFNISFNAQLEGATPAAYFGGSLAYMSPEQLEACNPSHPRQADELDGRADLYSLGVLLWELLYGQRPFRDEKLAAGWSETLAEMTARRRVGPPAKGDPLDHIEGEPELRQVLLKCLEPEPAQRFSSGEELAREMRLCHEARTQRILKLPESGWRELVRRHPIVALVVAAVSPNVVAGGFNLAFNNTAIIASLKNVEGAREAFDLLVIVVNAIAFPLGIGLGIFFAWPVLRRLRQLDAPPAPGEDVVALRVRALKLGHIIALIGVVLWSISGVVYPVAIHMILRDLTALGGVWNFYGLFAASGVLCGLIVMAYPFYFVTYLSVRVFYPALLRHGTLGEADEGALLSLRWMSNLYLILAVAVPVVGGLVFALASWVELFHQAQQRATWAPLAVAIAGVAGVPLTFWMNSVMQRDVAALLRAAAPPDSFGMGTDTLDAYF